MYSVTFCPFPFSAVTVPTSTRANLDSSTHTTAIYLRPSRLIVPALQLFCSCTFLLILEIARVRQHYKERPGLHPCVLAAIMSRFATVLALAMFIGTSSASGGCDKRAKGIFDCEGKELAYFEVRSTDN